MYICAVFIIKRITMSFSSFSLPGTCRECHRQANQRDDTSTPLPHAVGCVYENQVPVFAFPSQTRPCLECANLKKWEEDCTMGNVYCPGTPRVHTCGR